MSAATLTQSLREPAQALSRFPLPLPQQEASPRVQAVSGSAFSRLQKLQEAFVGKRVRLGEKIPVVVVIRCFDLSKPVNYCLELNLLELANRVEVLFFEAFNKIDLAHILQSDEIARANTFILVAHGNKDLIAFDQEGKEVWREEDIRSDLLGRLPSEAHVVLEVCCAGEVFAPKLAQITKRTVSASEEVISSDSYFLQLDRQGRIVHTAHPKMGKKRFFIFKPDGSKDPAHPSVPFPDLGAEVFFLPGGFSTFNLYQSMCNLTKYRSLEESVNWIQLLLGIPAETLTGKERIYQKIWGLSLIPSFSAQIMGADNESKREALIEKSFQTCLLISQSASFWDESEVKDLIEQDPRLQTQIIFQASFLSKFLGAHAGREFAKHPEGAIRWIHTLLALQPRLLSLEQQAERKKWRMNLAAYYLQKNTQSVQTALKLYGEFIGEIEEPFRAGAVVTQKDLELMLGAARTLVEKGYREDGNYFYQLTLKSIAKMRREEISAEILCLYREAIHGFANLVNPYQK